MSAPRIWINTGEVSGDLHGAHLLRAFQHYRPDIQAMGMGGPELRAAGLESILRVEDLSVMGFTEVLGHLPKILGLLRQIKAELAQRKPDAIILIDAPSFNFRVAAMASRLGIPVYYYISPKVWAWREGRVEFIKKYVRRMYCIFPFEQDFYARHNMSVEYIGNPLLDLIDLPRLDKIEPQADRLALMPGSRKKEISTLLPQFAGAVRLLRQKHPGLRAVCMAAPSVSEDYLRSFWPADLPLEIHPAEGRYEALRRCWAVLAASGTATLETALLGVPTLAAYKGSALSVWLARRFIKVPYISLANLILNRPAIPELIQQEADAPIVAATVDAWFTDPAARAQHLAGLAELRAALGPAGAARRAAAGMLADICPDFSAPPEL